MNQEKVFLHEEGHFVSNARIIVGNATYATANITSVSKRVRNPNITCAVLTLVGGSVMFLFALSMILVEENWNLDSFIFNLTLGLGIFIGGVAWIKVLKPTFSSFFPPLREK